MRHVVLLSVGAAVVIGACFRPAPAFSGMGGEVGVTWHANFADPELAASLGEIDPRVNYAPGYRIALSWDATVTGEGRNRFVLTYAFQNSANHLVDGSLRRYKLGYATFGLHRIVFRRWRVAGIAGGAFGPAFLSTNPHCNSTELFSSSNCGRTTTGFIGQGVFAVGFRVMEGVAVQAAALPTYLSVGLNGTKPFVSGLQFQVSLIAEE